MTKRSDSEPQNSPGTASSAGSSFGRWILASALIVPLCAWTGLERTGNDQVPCEDAEPETLESQRNCGRAVFARYCVECHATEDEKGPAFQATRLFGYTTVENLVFYTTFSMPQNDPGQLSDQGYWNVMAYVVDSLGMYAGSEVLSERNGSIPLIRP